MNQNTEEECNQYLEEVLAKPTKSFESEIEEKNWFQKLSESLSSFWNKTIFPDMIKQRKEEKDFKNKIMREARKEALSEMKDALKENIKQKELDKLTGKNNILEKLAKGFGGEGGGSSFSSDRIGKMLGTTSSSNNMGSGGVGSDEHIRKMMGLGSVQQPQVVQRTIYKTKKKKNKNKYYQQPQQNKIESYEEKMKRLLS